MRKQPIPCSSVITDEQALSSFFFFLHTKDILHIHRHFMHRRKARTHTQTHTHTHAHMHAHTCTHIHTYTHTSKSTLQKKKEVFLGQSCYRLIQLWDAVTGQLDFVDKVASVSFCGLCRLGSVDGAELREGNYHQKDRSVLADNFCPTRLLLHGQSC